MAPKKEKTAPAPLPVPKSLNYTLCVPSTIISKSNCKNLQQATATLYQLAKAASIYNVAEIVLLDVSKEPKDKVDLQVSSSNSNKKKFNFDDDKKDTAGGSQDEVSEDAMFIATVLQYFVTPPYLSKTIFKQRFHKNFQYAKDFPKLSTLPFMTPEVQPKYREGLTVQMGKITKPTGPNKKKSQPLKSTKFVNVGHDKYLELEGQQVPTNVRVTVDMSTKKVVSPIEAYAEQVGAKSSYGYHVRIAKKFSSVFTESSFPEGYSQSVWIQSGLHHKHAKSTPVLPIFEKTQQKGNLLLLCGKWSDLEYSFQLEKMQGVESAKEFFDGMLEIPDGSRVEDGALIALTKLNV